MNNYNNEKTIDSNEQFSSEQDSTTEQELPKSEIQVIIQNQEQANTQETMENKPENEVQADNNKAENAECSQQQSKKIQEPKPKKLTPFELESFFYYELIITNEMIAKIDGKLRYFDGKKNFEILDNKTFDNLVYSHIEKYIKNDNSLSSYTQLLKILKTKYSMFPDISSAENFGFLGFQNTIVNLNQLYEQQGAYYFDPQRMITYCLNVNFVYCFYSQHYINNLSIPVISYQLYLPPNAQLSIQALNSLSTPNMNNFLSQIANGDLEIITRIWEMIGYLLTPDTNGKVFFILQGESNTGKSVLGNLIKDMFPANKVSHLSINQLGEKFALSKIADSCINISMDLPNKTLTENSIGILKQLTGGDSTDFEVKYGDMGTYKGRCKFLFATNHTIKMNEIDDAFEKRIVVIPFNHPIPENQQDKNLLQKLIEEKNLIATKAVFIHYMNLRQRNYIFSGANNEKCKIYKNYKFEDTNDANALVKHFSDEKCYFGDLKQYRTHTSVLYYDFLEFCKENNYPQILTERGFSYRFASVNKGKVFDSKWRKGDTNKNGYKGVILKKHLNRNNVNYSNNYNNV